MSVTIRKNKKVAGLTKNVTNIGTSLDDLAGMVKEGFDEVHGTMKAGFDKVDNRLTSLETGQEEIKLRLSNVAYRFEIVELEGKVKALANQLKTLEQLVKTKIKTKANEA